MKKSNFLFLVETLELGIPIIHDGYIWKMFNEHGNNILKFGFVNNNGEMGYMGEFPLDFVNSMAKKLINLFPSRELNHFK